MGCLLCNHSRKYYTTWQVASDAKTLYEHYESETGILTLDRCTESIFLLHHPMEATLEITYYCILIRLLSTSNLRCINSREWFT